MFFDWFQPEQMQSCDLFSKIILFGPKPIYQLYLFCTVLYFLDFKTVSILLFIVLQDAYTKFDEIKLEQKLNGFGRTSMKAIRKLCKCSFRDSIPNSTQENRIHTFCERWMNRISCFQLKKSIKSHNFLNSLFLIIFFLNV